MGYTAGHSVCTTAPPLTFLSVPVVCLSVSLFLCLSPSLFLSRCPSLCAGLPLSVLCCVITCCLCFRCAALRVVLCAVLCRLPAASHVARRAASAPLVPCCVRLFLVSPSASSLPGGRDCLLSYFSSVSSPPPNTLCDMCESMPSFSTLSFSFNLLASKTQYACFSCSSKV